jgi:hypothetical protein
MQLLPIITSEITKAELKNSVLDTVEQLKETGGALQLTDLLSKIDFYIKELKANKEYLEIARDEISKYGKDITLPSGTKIELAEVGIKYDFSQCNDPILVDLERDLTKLEFEVEQRKKWLKTVPGEGIELHIGEGLLNKVYPPSKSSTSSIKTTLAK